MSEPAGPQPGVQAQLSGAGLALRVCAAVCAVISSTVLHQACAAGSHKAAQPGRKYGGQRSCQCSYPRGAALSQLRRAGSPTLADAERVDAWAGEERQGRAQQLLEQWDTGANLELGLSPADVQVSCSPCSGRAAQGPHLGTSCVPQVTKSLKVHWRCPGCTHCGLQHSWKATLRGRFGMSEALLDVTSAA